MAYFWRGEPLPRSGLRRGLLADQFDLIELEFDGRLASEHGHNHAHLVLFDVHHVDNAGERRQRTVCNLDGVAFRVGDDDLMLFNAQLLDLFVRQGVGLVPEPTKPVTPRTFLMIYHASSDMIIFTST